MKKKKPAKEVVVHVPATSGNIGPGFDVLGMALSIGNDLRIRVLNSKPGAPVVHLRGEGADLLPRDQRNIIFRCMKHVYSKAKKPVPKLELTCINRIPLSRGMGSSSAAILSGFLGANRLLGNRFSEQEILTMATKEEGHPDDVAPALFGGVQAAGFVDGVVVSDPLPIPNVELVVAVPDFYLPTKKARRILPKSIPMQDAISNLAAVALMRKAFAEDLGILKHLLNDRWHEPFRARLIPGFHQVKKAALNAGALGVTLSGAGPTILSFVEKKKLSHVSIAMHRAFKRVGVRHQILNLRIDKKGAIVK